MKRVIQVNKNLYFEYEVVSPNQRNRKHANTELPKEATEHHSDNDVELQQKIVTGMHIPFKQVRLKGQVNPLKGPRHSGQYQKARPKSGHHR
jgi:hypothetical protein